MKKTKEIKKTTTRKDTGKKNSTIKNGGEKDFGGIKKTDSSTEKRKNVNADPNLIQSNFLYDDDEQLLDL